MTAISMISGLETNERSYLIDKEGSIHTLETKDTIKDLSKTISQKLNDTMTYIRDFQVVNNNSTFNETIHQVASFVNHLLDNANESFFSLVNVLKQKLDDNKQTAKELILNVKKIASNQLKTIQEKLDQD